MPTRTHIVQDNQRSSPATSVIADGIEDAVAHQGREQLLNEESQQDTTYGCQVEVVDHEESVELESRAIAHDLTATEDNDVVGDQHGDGLLQCRHGRDALFEVERIGRVASDLGVEDVEDGPQVQAERTVEGRRADLNGGLQLLDERHGVYLDERLKRV